MTDAMQSATTCPVCNSAQWQTLFPNYEGTAVTSDFNVLAHAVIDNRCCHGCGLIYNAMGTRHFTEDFYKNSYSLLQRNEEAQIQNFSGNRPVSQGEKSLSILEEMLDLSPGSRILEAGAGKGDFLTYFVDQHPDWDVTALEPSKAYQTLKKRLPSAKLLHADYDGVESNPVSYDLLVALGVLEHVKNPLKMLNWAHSQLKPGGHFYIRVPNFESNPNDLFCADHLSKLTESSIQAMAQSVGFKVVAVQKAGVPIFVLLQKAATNAARTLTNVFDKNSVTARSNSEIASNAIAAVLQCRQAANQRGEQFAVFGLALSGLFAPYIGNFQPSEIAAYIDENRSVWGGNANERPIGGLQLISEQNIRHIAVVISPVYIAQVVDKLAQYDLHVYTPDGVFHRGNKLPYTLSRESGKGGELSAA